MDEEGSPESSELNEAEQVARARAFASALKTDKPGKPHKWHNNPSQCHHTQQTCGVKQ